MGETYAANGFAAPVVVTTATGYLPEATLSADELKAFADAEALAESNAWGAITNAPNTSPTSAIRELLIN